MAGAQKLNDPDTAMVAVFSSCSQFEVAIGTAMVLFGIGSGVALATVTGPLLEIPLMVSAARFLRRSAPRFEPARSWQTAAGTDEMETVPVKAEHE